MSYQGIIAPIPVGQGGLDLRSNRTAVPPQKIIAATNVEIIEGKVGKEGGSTKANTTVLSGSPAVIEGMEYFPTATVQRTVIATSDGALYKDSGAFTFPTTLKTGLGTDKATVFVEGGKEVAGNNKKLFSFNGNDPVQVLSGDGATTTNLTTPPADWTGTTQPVAGANHNLRLWGILNHSLYGSVTTNHEDFTGAGSQIFAVFPGEGTRLFGIIPIFGRLYLFKEPLGIYFLDDSDNTSSNWRIKKLSSQIGIAGPNAIGYTSNEALFVSSEGGVHFLSGVQEFGDVKASDLSSILNIERLTREEMNKNRLDRIHVGVYEDKKQAWICYTSKSGTRNDRILKLDYSDVSNVKATVTEKDSCESVWIFKDATTAERKPFLGGSDGFVRKADQSSRNVDGAAYNGRFQTPFLTFDYFDRALHSQNKNFDFLEIEAEPVGNHNISVNIFIDSAFSETITFNMGEAGAALDSFDLDTDRLDGSGITIRRRFFSGHGRSISFDVQNNGVNQDFQIANMTVGFRPGGEDVRA